jgi:hypothetical protein
MLRSLLSVTIVEVANTRRAVSQRAPVMSLITSDKCAFQIFIDGLLFSDQGDVTNVPTPSDIGGVEIYFGPATIPLEYKRDHTQCGIILIWTKGGS